MGIKISPIRLTLFSYIVLSVDNLRVHNLHSAGADIVHILHPIQGIFRLELFRDTLCLFHLLYKRFQTLLSLFVNVGKITIQLAACQQIHIQNFMVLFEMPSVPLSRIRS